jgi:glutamate-1-semialdehyde 2,1-aminomutase
MNFTRSQAFLPRFHAVIPGGAHTYAKGDDQYPEGMAPFIVRGSGCRVWDVDGNEFIEYGSGLRAVTLGHAFPAVVEAARAQLGAGSNFVRPSPLELECAEELQAMVPGAEMVKFGKHGSDAVNAAVKLSRAYTGRDLVGICEDHPFYSIDDWFIGTTPMNAGIPSTIPRLVTKFRYNDLASATKVFEDHPDQVACLVLEPERLDKPEPGYLEKLKSLCQAHGCMLVFDENITGFRWHNGGAGAFHGVTADLSAYGKGIANGFAVSAVTGRRDLMKLGGWDHGEERVFLLSTTHGAELHGLAAAMATLRCYREQPIVETLWRQGSRLAEGVMQASRALGIEERFFVVGRPCCLLYATRDQNGEPSQPFRTLFLQELIRRGILAPSFVVNFSHSDCDIERTLEAVAGALEIYRKALEDGVDRYLEGRPVRPVFRKRG